MTSPASSDRFFDAPDENLAAYGAIYRIEVGLREFVIERLASVVGPRWWKERLPGDVLKSFRSSLAIERGSRWIQTVPHHPIYYVDFPDLKKIIDRTDNWRDVFAPTFKRKDVFLAALTELEPIRNKVAHNRRVTPHGVAVAEGVLMKIVAAIGDESFAALVARCTEATDIHGLLMRLLEGVKDSHSSVTELREVDDLSVWTEIDDSWWFDEDYLGHELKGITQYFDALVEYALQPRRRGTGHKLKEWVVESGLDDLGSLALSKLQEITAVEV